jgi:hypothetical protein
LALPFTRPRHIQPPPPTELGGSGSDRSLGGCGLFVVDELVDLINVVECVCAGNVGPGDVLVASGKLGHGPVGAEHQLLHR